MELGRDKAWLAFHERRISTPRFEEEMHLCGRDSECVDQYDGTRHHIYADDDTVIVFFDAKGAARDGKPYENTYAWFLDMRAGKIVKAFAFFDSVEFNDYWQRIKL